MLHKFRKGGGELVDAELVAKLLELHAKDGPDRVPLEERSALLEKHAKRVNIFRAWLVDGRKRFLDTLSEQEKLAVAQCEILMLTLAQSSERLKREEVRKAEKSSSCGRCKFSGSPTNAGTCCWCLAMPRQAKAHPTFETALVCRTPRPRRVWTRTGSKGKAAALYDVGCA